MTPTGRDARQRPVVALCGGIGGAKLALGLARVISGDDLVIVVNTGDDFRHLGLHISPDIDTVAYTLAGLANPETGWGRKDETWNFMEALGDLGGETWFQLGDRDLALHVERTRRLAAGETLSDVTADLCRQLGIEAHVAPMSDDPVRTVVETDVGTLPFQRYFVAERCVPVLRAVRFEGAGEARPAPAVRQALARQDLAGVVICPSNPWLSVDPLLAVPGMREAVRASGAPVVAVSPIVGGQAVKGPTAKIMAELGLEVSPAAIARHYEGLIDGFVVDQRDADKADGIGGPVAVEQTVMQSEADKIALARQVLNFCTTLKAGAALEEGAA
ncbi:MAG: 2-phospho-L-lactate transferase [Methyloligellaceae bacterium]